MFARSGRLGDILKSPLKICCEPYLSVYYGNGILVYTSKIRSSNHSYNCPVSSPSVPPVIFTLLLLSTLPCMLPHAELLILDGSYCPEDVVHFHIIHQRLIFVNQLPNLVVPISPKLPPSAFYSFTYIYLFFSISLTQICVYLFLLFYFRACFTLGIFGKQ